MDKFLQKRPDDGDPDRAGAKKLRVKNPKIELVGKNFHLTAVPQHMTRILHSGKPTYIRQSFFPAVSRGNH